MARMAEQTENATMTEAGPVAGERALMRAVLEDAIRCLSREIGPVRERPRLAAEARAWIQASDLRWPLSFDNVCGYLGFHAERLRSRLLRDASELPAMDNGQQASDAARPSRKTPVEREIMRMIREGRPLRVVAETFGISISKASILSCGLASRIKAERDDEIRRLRSVGWTRRALAVRFGLSRIRIMRICARRRVDEDRSAAARFFAARDGYPAARSRSSADARHLLRVVRPPPAPAGRDGQEGAARAPFFLQVDSPVFHALGDSHSRR